MPRKMFKIAAAIAVIGCVFGMPTPRASAVGYWNMPGNFCQCWGYGWGAGYHSCLVLGPPSCDGILNPHEVRLMCAPGPPSYCDHATNCGCASQSVFEPSTL